MKILCSAFLLVVLFLAVGCGSQDSMSSSEQANFKGGTVNGQRSPEQQKAIKDFAEEFKRKHPDINQGGPPAGTPTDKGTPP